MSNEAARMRAKIEGKLNCSWCMHFHERGETWCNRRDKSPKRGPLSEQHCDEFVKRQRRVDMGLHVIHNSFFPKEGDEV